MISIESVSASYGALRVLDDVTVQIPAGGVTSLIGPNGAGKSTLLGIVARLQTPDSGRVTVGGLDVSTAGTRELATRLAILRQENHTTLRLTVRDLVEFGRFPHTGGRMGPEDRELVDEALGHVDLLALADRPLDELSGGQRQRAYIAMVLAQGTDVLLLDEPLNNLDLRHSVETMRLVRRLADEFGKTVVMVVHDINFASTASDRLLALKDGRVAAFGSCGEVMQPEILREIFEIDVRVLDVEGHRLGLTFL